jgi:hypothetical protein
MWQLSLFTSKNVCKPSLYVTPDIEQKKKQHTDPKFLVIYDDRKEDIMQNSDSHKTKITLIDMMKFSCIYDNVQLNFVS